MESDPPGAADNLVYRWNHCTCPVGRILAGGRSHAKPVYGAVLEIPAVEFRFFSPYRRENTIDNGLGKVLRTIHTTYGANIVKLERPIHYEAYLESEHSKLEQLRESFEKAMITEEELKARVEVMYDRIAEVEKLCGDEKIVEPFYYIALFDGDKRQLENQIRSAMMTLSSAEMHPKRLHDKELAVFLKYSNCLDIQEEEIDTLKPADYARWAMPQYVNVKMRTVEVNGIVTHNLRVSWARKKQRFDLWAGTFVPPRNGIFSFRIM